MVTDSTAVCHSHVDDTYTIHTTLEADKAFFMSRLLTTAGLLLAFRDRCTIGAPLATARVHEKLETSTLTRRVFHMHHPDDALILGFLNELCLNKQKTNRQLILSSRNHVQPVKHRHYCHKRHQNFSNPRSATQPPSTPSQLGACPLLSVPVSVFCQPSDLSGLSIPRTNPPLIVQACSSSAHIIHILRLRTGIAHVVVTVRTCLSSCSAC